MMNSRLVRGALASGVMFAALGASLPAQAVPAFARQTGMACYSCHFQSFPALNSFGRSFKAAGYTMVGAQGLIEGEHLSLPDTLNTSLITKIRYQKQDSDDRGELQWPDEAAFLVGGRASEHSGFLTEIALAAQEGEGTADLTTGEVSTETNGNFLSFKYHYNVTDAFSIGLFGTDALGPGYGFELLNTGLQRSQRPIENRAGMSAFHAAAPGAGSGQLGSGAATGLAFAYHTEQMYVVLNHWAPTYSNVDANIFGGLANYVRAVYMPTVGDWDVGVGVGMSSGDIDVGAVDPATTVSKIEFTALDAQAQGQLGGMSAGFYFSYGSIPANSYYNAAAKDQTSMALLGKFGVAPMTNAFVAYSNSDNGAKTTRTTIGAQYELAQNIELEVFNENVDAAGTTSSQLMLLMFAAF